MKTIIDISQPVGPGIAVWPGDTPYERRWNMRIDQGQSVNLSDIRLSVHTGTHADAPLHFQNNGAGMDAVQLHRYVGPARVVKVPAGAAVRREVLERYEWNRTPRCLLHTGSSSDRQVFNADFMPLSTEAAGFLAEKGICLLGTDSPSVDAFSSKDLPVHLILAGAGIAILENLNLAGVPEGEYELIALPLRLVGSEASPVRAVLRPLG